MPTMTLTAVGGTGSIFWSLSGGNLLEVLASDDGLTASGSSYASCSNDHAAISDLAMTSLGSPNLPVAEEDMDATNPITSVRFLAVGRMPSRGTSGTDLDIEFDTPSGFGETLNFFNNANYEVEYGTTRTERPDSASWSYGNIEGLKFNITKNGTAPVHLAYFAVEVVYKLAAVSAVNNATFFGANF